MKEEQLRTLIKYRLEQSKETLDESEILYTKDSYKLVGVSNSNRYLALASHSLKLKFYFRSEL